MNSRNANIWSRLDSGLRRNDIEFVGGTEALTAQTKSGPDLSEPPVKLMQKSVLRCFGFVVAALNRAAVEALGVDVAVDELDHRQRGVVAVAEAGLQDADIAALTVLVARAEDGEQLARPESSSRICAIA